MAPKEVLGQGESVGSSSSWPLSCWVLSCQCSLTLHPFCLSRKSRVEGWRHWVGQPPALCYFVCGSSPLLYHADSLGCHQVISHTALAASRLSPVSHAYLLFSFIPGHKPCACRPWACRMPHCPPDKLLLMLQNISL